MVSRPPHEREHLLEDIFANAPLGLAVTDASGMFAEVTSAFCELLGRPATDLRRTPYVDVVHPEDWREEEGRLAELLRGNVTWYRVQARYVRPNGEVRFVTVKASLVDGPGAVIRRVIDLTERRRAEQERSRFFDLAHDLIAIVGFDGRLNRVNPAFTRVLGWTEQELLDRPMDELVHPDDIHRLRAQFYEAGGFTGGSVGFEARALAKDGSYRWLHSTMTPIPSEGLIYSWSVDITKRKEAEELLRQREAQLAEAQQLAHLGSWEWDIPTGNSTWSVEFDRILGLAEEPSAPGLQTFLDRTHPDDRELVEHVLNSALEDGTPLTFDSRVVRPDGSERLVHAHGRVEVDQTGAPARLRATVQDVTDWRGTEAALRESEERFRRVFDEGPVGIVIVDCDLRCIRANAAFSEMLGELEERLNGRPLAEVTHPDDVSLDAQLAQRAFAGEIPGWEIEKRFAHRAGHMIWARLRGFVIRGRNGGSPQGFVLVEDISEAKAAEIARRELDTLKDGFLRVVSHDLQNPLVAIAGLADALAEGRSNVAGEEQQLLRRIATQADRLRRMVASFLDVDRLYQGAGSALRRPTDLADLAARVIERIDQRDHQLTVDVASTIADVDPDQVDHILENLLENAYAHTPSRTAVRLQIEKDPAAVMVVVEDTGPGIPDHLKETIFRLFQTGNKETRRTGIGLWTVARFAELHGGRAWVEDRPGGGAVFRVILPVTGSELDQSC